MQNLKLRVSENLSGTTVGSLPFSFGSFFFDNGVLQHMLRKSRIKFFQMQSSGNIMGMVPLPYFDIRGDLIALDEALSPVRQGQQC